MTHYCGLVIENVLQKDQGTWKCHMNLMDEESNVHTIDKIIDLNVRKRKKSPRHPRQKKKKRRGDQFSLYDDGDLYGSGDGSGDGYRNEISRGVLYKHDYGLIKWIKITKCILRSNHN